MWNRVLLFFSDRLFDRLAKDNGLVEKYEKEALKPQEKIGNRVWMFWYTGFDTAPSVVKKCVEVVERFEDVDLVLLDKNNLEQYFTFEGRIRELYEKGSIPIQTLADMVRFQLVKRWGGVWVDATCFVCNPDFFKMHADLTYYSVRHKHDETFPSYGKWSIWLTAGGRGCFIYSYLYDLLLAYLDRYDGPFTYLFVANAYLYIYNHNTQAKVYIDNLPFENQDAYFLQNNYFKPCDLDAWNNMMENNVIQKLTYRREPPSNCDLEKTYSYFFEKIY